jgi:hypothetical protein
MLHGNLPCEWAQRCGMAAGSLLAGDVHRAANGVYDVKAPNEILYGIQANR